MTDAAFRQTSTAMGRLVVPFTVLASLGAIQLYVFPNDTDRFFAWTLLPQLSATFMGAGFAAGVVLTVLSFRRQPWAITRTAAITIFVFVAVMTFATFAHLDRMHLESDITTARLAAWLWTVVYVIVPPALLVLIVLQRKMRGEDPPRVRPLPNPLRGVLAGIGGLMVIAGLGLLVMPVSMDAVWPWELTTLVGRALSAWLISIGLAGIWVVGENDVTRTRPAAVTFAVAGGLWLLALIRGSQDMRWERPSSWIYLAVVVSALVTGLWGWALSREVSDSPATDLRKIQRSG